MTLRVKGYLSKVRKLGRALVFNLGSVYSAEQSLPRISQYGEFYRNWDPVSEDLLQFVHIFLTQTRL